VTALAFTAVLLAPPIGFEGDAPVPPTLESALQRVPRRKLGTSTTVFVNFDGVTLDECSISDSHRGCHWIDPGRTYEPFSGSQQTKLGVIQAAQSIARPFGIRVTGLRPPDTEDYAMVVYSGQAEEEGALGLAPAGDCNDNFPNQIAFAYLDGARNSWVNGGATTVMHEAGHTWGLDHVDVRYSTLFPAGDDSRTAYDAQCEAVVSDAMLTEDTATCPDLSVENCGTDQEQNASARLFWLFGPAYVDTTPPALTLVEPFDGQYFEGPVDLDVQIDVWDDLHPQVYQVEVMIEGLTETPAVLESYDGSFSAADIPLGEHQFVVSVRDEAGNRSSIEFEVIVGDQPIESLPLDDGFNCSVATRRGSSRAFTMLWLLFPAAARCGRWSRRRRRPY
jgi:hypothetical protein